MRPPCIEKGVECKERRVGCQSQCPKMKKYQLFNALEMQERHKEQFKNDVTAQSVLRVIGRKK